MRALITGASGLAGTWLCRACAGAGDEVLGVSRRGTVPDGCGHGLALDLRDAAAVDAALRDFRPDVVYHLAALSSVGRSWERPGETLSDNGLSTAGVLEALRARAAAGDRVRVVWVSSCEVYGAPVRLPIAEDAELRPANPYAVSKAAGEMLAQLYADAFGLDLVRVRPFSHSGPGQRPIFLLSNLCRQAAVARRRGAAHLRIVTGNPDTRRDFTDVRDVVRAYRRLGAGGAPGAVYNVSSGVSVSAADQVALLAELVAPLEVQHVVDPALVRAHEVLDLRGDPARLTADTGWAPEIRLRQTMSDTLAWWEHELRDSPAR